MQTTMIHSNPRNPQRFAFLRKLTSSSDARADTPPKAPEETCIMNATIDRRALLTATTVASLACGGIEATAVPAHNGRREVSDGLLPLLAAWNDARDTYEAFIPIHDAAEERYFATRPKRPKMPAAPQSEAEIVQGLTIAEFRTYKSPSAVNYEAALAAWEKANKTAKKASGCIQTDRRMTILIRAESDAANAVLAFPAKTVHDLAAKMGVHKHWEFNEPDLIDALGEDIARIAAAGAH